MTKTISIYAAQILLGVIAIAAGYAKLTGAGLMVQQFQTLGLGQGFLSVAGTAEIVAGLCLLLPRGGILGAVLLTCVMVGALGVTIGHVASAVAQPAGASLTATASNRLPVRPPRHRHDPDLPSPRRVGHLIRFYHAANGSSGACTPASGQPEAGVFSVRNLEPDQSRA